MTSSLEKTFWMLFVCLTSFFIKVNAAVKKEEKKIPLSITLASGYSISITVLVQDGIGQKKIISGKTIPKGKKEIFRIPDKYLPGEVILQTEYVKTKGDVRKKKMHFLIVKEALNIVIDPLGSAFLQFEMSDLENPVFSGFLKEQENRVEAIQALEHVLAGKTKPVKEKPAQEPYEKYRQAVAEYNDWIKKEAARHRELYVSHLYVFFRYPEYRFDKKGIRIPDSIVEQYFDNMDFEDPLLVTTNRLSKYFQNYIDLFTLQYPEDYDVQDSLVLEVSRNIVGKVYTGHPLVYGWAVDFLYKGIERGQYPRAMAYIEKVAMEGNCWVNNVELVRLKLKGSKYLNVGDKAPDFVSRTEPRSNYLSPKFQLYTTLPTKPYRLIVFWLAGCGHCLDQIREMASFTRLKKNSDLLEIIAINIDEDEEAIPLRNNIITANPDWVQLVLDDGVSNEIARNYVVYQTLTMVLLDSKTNEIKSIPNDLIELEESLPYN